MLQNSVSKPSQQRGWLRYLGVYHPYTWIKHNIKTESGNFSGKKIIIITSPKEAGSTPFGTPE